MSGIGIKKPRPSSSNDSNALRALLLRKLATNQTVFQTERDKSRMFGMIEKRIYSRDLQELEDDNTKEYVIPIKSFSFITDGVVHGKKKYRIKFLVTD